MFKNVGDKTKGRENKPGSVISPAGEKKETVKDKQIRVL